MPVFARMKRVGEKCRIISILLVISMPTAQKNEKQQKAARAYAEKRLQLEVARAGHQTKQQIAARPTLFMLIIDIEQISVWCSVMLQTAATERSQRTYSR